MNLPLSPMSIWQQETCCDLPIVSKFDVLYKNSSPELKTDECANIITVTPVRRLLL